MFGWGLYLAASAAFLSLGSVPVSIENGAAAVHEADSLVDGLAKTINSIVPGVNITLHYQTVRRVQVWLYQRTIMITDGSVLLRRNLTWWSPFYELEASATYSVGLEGGRLHLVEKGLG